MNIKAAGFRNEGRFGHYKIKGYLLYYKLNFFNLWNQNKYTYYIIKEI